MGCSGTGIELVADELAGVWFVMDYVQLQFGFGVTTFYAWPKVSIGGTDLTFGQAGYRDALCSFIGQAVLASEVFRDDGFVITFPGGELVVTPDQIRDAPDPEVIWGHAIAIGAAQVPFDLDAD